jgi:phosphoglycerate kinase
MQKITDINITNKSVLLRADLNVPIHNGQITSHARLQAMQDSIEYILSQKVKKLIICSHLGRPKADISPDQQPEFSMQLVALALGKLINQPVALYDSLDADTLPDNHVILLENVRFHPGETKNDSQLSQQYAQLADIFVMDAFATAHRKHASTYGVIQFAPQACAGPLLTKEITAIDKALKTPHKPVVAVVGGAKVSTKLNVLNNLLHKVDSLIVVGAMANTFFAAQGLEIGKSLYEANLIPDAKGLLNNPKLILPLDAQVATELTHNAVPTTKEIEHITQDEMILDIGLQSVTKFKKIIAQASTIIWNGPAGAFEFKPFAAGTNKLGEIIAASDAYSLAGGGDTVAAIEANNLTDKISYISTAGGAFLEYVEQDTLPVLSRL